MNIKEVRVGNYLLGNQYSYEDNYKLFQVESIHPNGLNVWDGREMGILADYEWEYVKPIPITEEWLNRLGYKKELARYDSYHIYSEYYIGKSPFKKGYWIFETGDVELQYVHQLQNLYFALTAQELSAE